MPALPLLEYNFEVRWRMEYHDHKAPKIGMWTRPAVAFNEMAALQKTENLARAIIETKDRRTKQIRTAIHCNGQDYCKFNWESGARFGFGRINGELKLPSQILGLTLITRELEATILVDGSDPIIKKRTESDKSFHYAGYGR